MFSVVRCHMRDMIQTGALKLTDMKMQDVKMQGRKLAQKRQTSEAE